MLFHSNRLYCILSRYTDLPDCTMSSSSAETQLKGYALTFSLLTCWNRIKVDDDMVFAFKNLSTLKTNVLKLLILSEEKWFDKSSDEEKMLNCNFFMSNGFYNQICKLENEELHDTMKSLVSKWHDFLHESDLNEYLEELKSEEFNDYYAKLADMLSLKYVEDLDIVHGAILHLCNKISKVIS